MLDPLQQCLGLPWWTKKDTIDGFSFIIQNIITYGNLYQSKISRITQRPDFYTEIFFVHCNYFILKLWKLQCLCATSAKIFSFHVPNYQFSLSNGITLLQKRNSNNKKCKNWALARQHKATSAKEGLASTFEQASQSSWNVLVHGTDPLQVPWFQKQRHIYVWASCVREIGKCSKTKFKKLFCDDTMNNLPWNTSSWVSCTYYTWTCYALPKAFILEYPRSKG